MKKGIIFLVLMLLVVSPLFAAGITDAVKPLGHLKFSATVEDNYIFKKDIEKKDSLKFEPEKINQVYAKLGLGLTPYFNLYTKLGMSNGGEIKRDNVSTSKEIKIETDYGFLWGVGVSGIKEVSGGWKVGLDTQFNSWKEDVDKVKVDGTTATTVSGEIENYEFQITPLLTRKFDISACNWSLNPYLGVPINLYRTQTDRNIKFTYSSVQQIESWTLRGDNYVGILVGSDLEINKNCALQVEGRFIDETAITVGGTYRF